MSDEYLGKREREACAARIGAELTDNPPVQPLTYQTEMRVRGMHARCSSCRACPLIIRALGVMLPLAEEPPSAIVYRLAS